MSKISPCLWHVDQAEQAAEFYVSLFPDSRIDRVVRTPTDTPGPREGDVIMVEFTLAGSSYLALNGGRRVESSQLVSLSVDCADQAEVDRYWNALTADGGEEIQCGWCRDRWGIQWQIVPRILPQLLGDPDRARARRAMEAMFAMKKIDVAAIQRAADG